MEPSRNSPSTEQPPARNLAQEKWRGALRAGFQVIPNILIQAHRQLELDPLDVLILLNINMHWWEAAVLPYPKPAMIAERIGVSRRTVERRLNAMQKSGLLQRLPAEQARGTSIRRIRLTGLVERLAGLAEVSPGLKRRLPAGGLGDESDDAAD